jgi:hypothetical protein
MTADPRVLKVGEEPPPFKGSALRASRKGKKPPGTKSKGKAGDRFRTLNAFVDFTLASLTCSEIAIWLILWRDTKDGIARTSFDDLARRAGCNRRQVSRAMGSLRTKGLAKVVHQGGFRRGVSTYRVQPLCRSP